MSDKEVRLVQVYDAHGNPDGMEHRKFNKITFGGKTLADVVVEKVVGAFGLGVLIVATYLFIQYIVLG